MIQIDKCDKPPIPGKYYLVPCIQSEREITGFHIGEWVPIIGGLHSDPEIGADFLHFHYDLRFCDRIVAANATIVIAVHRYGQTPFPTQQTPIEYRRKQCRRANNENFRNYAYNIVRSLEALMDDKRMVDFICPHRGVNLASVPHKRGCVTCPAHGLAWHVETGELAKIPTFSLPTR